MAIGDLPQAFPGLFEKYLGHSMYQMVYRQEDSGITFGELWINRWQDRTATGLQFLIFAAVVWAIVNVSRKHAPRANAFALLLIVGWICLIVWATSVSVMF